MTCPCNIKLINIYFVIEDVVVAVSLSGMLNIWMLKPNVDSKVQCSLTHNSIINDCNFFYLIKLQCSKPEPFPLSIVSDYILFNIFLRIFRWALFNATNPNLGSELWPTGSPGLIAQG